MGVSYPSLKPSLAVRDSLNSCAWSIDTTRWGCSPMWMQPGFKFGLNTELVDDGWAIEKSMQQISSSSNPRGGFCASYLWPLKMCQDSILKSSSVRWLQSKMSKSKNKQAFANIPRFAHIRAFSASVHANQGFPATIEVHEQLDQGDKKRVVWIAVISISESSNLWGHILYTQSPLKVFFAACLYCLYFADEIICRIMIWVASFKEFRKPDRKEFPTCSGSQPTSSSRPMPLFLDQTLHVQRGVSRCAAVLSRPILNLDHGRHSSQAFCRTLLERTLLRTWQCFER